MLLLIFYGWNEFSYEGPDNKDVELICDVEWILISEKHYKGVKNLIYSGIWAFFKFDFDEI